MLSLNDPSLFRQAALVGSEWIEADSSTGIEVTNPATGELLGLVPNLGAAETDKAIAAAEEARGEWAARVAKDRTTVLRKWFDLMMENQEDLAKILTAEQGKPLPESLGEIGYGASFIEWFADEARRAYGDVIPGHAQDKRIIVLKQAVGVIAAITPWNFPTAMITRKAGPAFAAGCSMVLKPASQTPFSATFTGSTEVGAKLYEQCAPTIKKLALELGGNAPFIVFDDADIDAAVDGAIIAKFRNNGQTCVCANRIYVQDAVYDEFARKLQMKIATLSVGNGIDEGVVFGPLIDAAAVEKVEEHISDALSRGAQLIAGGERHELGGNFFQPTILTDVTADMAVASEETFGPVAPLFRFTREADVVMAANNTEFGLASYFYSTNMARIWRVGEALDYGMVGVNTGLVSTVEAPFGGVKLSGLGREGSHYGLDEFFELKYLCLGGIDAENA